MIKIIYMAIFVLIIVGCGNNSSTNTNKIRYLKVPSEFLTIQSAVDTANNGDVVLIDNGIYYENINIVNKSIVLTSNFHNSNLDSDINSTIIDGTSDTVISIDSYSENTEIVGLTIQNGNDGISPASKVVIKNNIIKNNIDGIDYEGGGGVCYYNTIINNKDDAIDLDGSVDVAEILPNTDILITDYSSVFFDFLLTNRPIIFAPFDYEKYITKDRELYYDYDEVTPGPKCKNWEEVLEWIVKFKENPNLFKKEREEVKNRFHKYQDGRSCERVFNEIVKL